MKKKPEILLFDANVLIDLCNADKSLLKKLNDKLFDIYIPDLIISEVNNLDTSELKDFGINILNTPISILNQANFIKASCSLQDTVCLIQAKNNHYSLATNDKKLRKECIKAGIKIYWGLELILILAEAGDLTKSKALKNVHIIANKNKVITKELVKDFEKKLKIKLAN
jgi:rRNA-processing protein FCF1